MAKNLIEADDIGRKAVADFIDSLLVKKKYVFHIPHKMLQANKVLMLARTCLRGQARRNCPIYKT